MSVDKLNISDFLLNFFGSTKAKETWESDKSIFDNIGNGNDYSEYDAVSIGKELLELQEKLNTTNDKKSRQAIQKAIQDFFKIRYKTSSASQILIQRKEKQL